MIPGLVTLAQTSVAQATTDGFDPNDVSPGVLGFLVIFVAALACIPLFWSMTAKLRKVDRKARLEEEAAAPADPAAAPGPATLGEPDANDPGPAGPTRPTVPDPAPEDPED